GRNDMDEKSTSLSDRFLEQLVADLDDDTIRAIILHGSYARNEAMPPYSDIDLVRIVQESPNPSEHKRFLYRDGYLISISSRPLSIYRQRFAQPEKAIFAVPGVREARILLDKDGTFQTFQQEAWIWMWEPLQTAANAYVSQLMVEQTEIVLKILRALALQDVVALADMIFDLFSAITEAIAVQRGVLVRSGNTYFHQVQEAVGQRSAWTQLHLRVAGIEPQPALSALERGREALSLYKTTAQLLRSFIAIEYWSVIAPVLQMIEHALQQKQVG
ncbi:MAG: nucleotidyltransferase domain-containing protein, partial [Ktedonobacteraceae bacterium]